MDITPATQELVNAVKAHAQANYEKGGWDVVVEAWTDAEIAEAIGAARTPAGAIAKFAPLVSVWADRQAEADSYADPF